MVMHGIPSLDPGRQIDWGKTSADYTLYRPGPPPSFYRRLQVLGVGLSGQRILDLGTGTGLLARTFAQQGASVCGTDISPEQIAAAQQHAQEEELDVEFRVSAAETIPFPDHEFDAITANQCWLYFDKSRTIPEVKRALKPGGVLVTSHFSWLPRLDTIARETEALILKHNSQWTAADYTGVIPAFPAWAQADFRLRAMFYYDEAIPFTRDAWRGRIRACRGIGAALSPEEVRRFDEEHACLLERLVPESFTVLHRLDAHFFEPL
jgi:SAM-dependent methyltransferase